MHLGLLYRVSWLPPNQEPYSREMFKDINAGNQYLDLLDGCYFNQLLMSSLLIGQGCRRVYLLLRSASNEGKPNAPARRSLVRPP